MKNNIIINYNKYFDDQEEFNIFKKNFNRIMYAKTEKEFDHE